MGCRSSLHMINAQELIRGNPDAYLLLSNSDLRNCRYSWEMILASKTPTWINKGDNIPHHVQSCAEWFGSLLYEDLFAECPHARRLFDRGSVSRNSIKNLVCMISKCLFILESITKSFIEQDIDEKCSKGECLSGVNHASTGEDISVSLTARSGGVRTAGENIVPLSTQLGSIEDKADNVLLVDSRESYSPGRLLSTHHFVETNHSESPSCRIYPLSGKIATDAEMTEKVNRFDGLMKGVAQSHREMKVRRSDFFAFGESTLKALSVVLGNEVYSQEMEQSWLRMYSVMIRAILKEYPEQLDNLEEEMSEFENISYCCNITPPSRDAIPHSSSQRARKLVSVTSA